MRYSRNKLESLRLIEGKPPEFDAIVQYLVTKVLSHEEISLAEQQFVCGIVDMLRNDKNELAYDLKDYPSCSDYLFRSKYLLYFNNINGHKPVMNYNGEVSANQKIKDVSFLQKTYEDWYPIIESKLNGTSIINYVAQETKHQLRELDKYCNSLSIGCNQKKYLTKSIVLHGKYIFLLVKEFYQEQGTDKIEIDIEGKTVLIDAFTYVHTMFRHYAALIKEHQQGKSYHYDENIGFKTIPDFLVTIIKCYKLNAGHLNFNNRNIFLKLNGKFYAIWLRPFKISLPDNIHKEYLRVQTFYPIELKSDLDKFVNAIEIETDCGFTFVVKNAI
jgi:hypothetical protein